MFKTNQVKEPQAEDLYTETLNTLYDGSTLKRSRIIKDTLAPFGIRPTARTYKDKVNTVITLLAYSGYIKNIETGYWRITDSGKKAVKDNNPEELITHLKEQEQRKKAGEPPYQEVDTNPFSFITAKVANIAKRMFPL